VKRALRAALVVVLVLALVAIGGWLWYTQPQPLLPEAEASLASTPEVTFAEVGGRLEWAPAGGSPTAGLIVYPGGKVPPAAYGPLAQAIAAEGYLVSIVEFPFNLAVFDINAADDVLAAHPEIETWAIGGHSLGGAMAAQYAGSHDAELDGLALWAAYPANDLSGAGLEVTSVYGTLDAGAARMGGAEAAAMLPPATVFVPIEGGNHGQMGWYTGQPNDPPATISREDQQAQVAVGTVELLERIEAP
jgi:predicted alpha/beta hydrolase